MIRNGSDLEMYGFPVCTCPTGHDLCTTRARRGSCALSMIRGGKGCKASFPLLFLFDLPFQGLESFFPVACETGRTSRHGNHQRPGAIVTISGAGPVSVRIWVNWSTICSLGVYHVWKGLRRSLRAVQPDITSSESNERDETQLFRSSLL